MALMPDAPPGAPDAPPPSPDSDGVTPPLASPMSAPGPNLGNKEGAMVTIAQVLDMLERAQAAFGSETPEGGFVRGAIGQLTKILGPKRPMTNELQANSILQLLGQLPKAGNVTPEVAAAMGIRPGMAAPPPPPGGGGPVAPPGGAGGPSSGAAVPPQPPGGAPPQPPT